MPVEIIRAEEAPRHIAKGFSAYRSMSEWTQAISLLGHIRSGKVLRIQLSKESRNLVKCARPAQQFAAHFRHYLKANHLPFIAYTSAGFVCVKPAAGIQSYTTSPAKQTSRRGKKTKRDQGATVTCAFCKSEHASHPNAKEPWCCALPECKRKKAIAYNRDWQRKKYQEKKATLKQTAKPERAEELHDAPAFSETAKALIGLEPGPALIEYARLHGRRLMVDEAAPELSRAGVFYAPAIWKKITNQLGKMPEFKCQLLDGAPEWVLTI